MAGYIGSKAAVTQVDGYTKTEADARYVEGDDTLYVDQTNNRVGIGNSSPDKKLDVDTTMRVRNAAGSSAAELDVTSGATWRVRSNPTSGTNSYGLDFIKGSGGTDVKMAIDASGRVTMPYQPSFRVKGGTSGWVSVGTNTNTTVIWNATLHNIGSHFSSNVFTAPVAGRYIINQSIYARLNSGHGDNTNYWTSHFAVNGSIVESTSIVGYHSDGDYDNAYTATTILNLSASDYVSIIMRGNGVQADYYDNNCYFSGHLLG